MLYCKVEAWPLYQDPGPGTKRVNLDHPGIIQFVGLHTHRRDMHSGLLSP